MVEGHPDGAVLSCWVVPGASRSEISGIHGSALKVRVSAPPQAGRANRELVRVLEAAFECRCRLLSGETRRHKRVLLEGIDPARARGTVSRWSR
ncbi:MAG: DUF167 domain-containing protein [Acidimicrobiia bacterium]